MDSLRRFPDLSKADAAVIGEWYKTDPKAALEYRCFLRNQSYSDKQHRRHSISLEALTETGTVQFGRKGRDESLPPKRFDHFEDFFGVGA